MNREDVTGIVFCGGGGRRLGGVEKPLIDINGKPLVALVMEQLRGQVARIVISCGGNVEAYAGFACEVIADDDPGEGPLGGFACALVAVRSRWVFTCPGDTPRMAKNLVELLAKDAERTGVAVPHDGLRRQNLFMLIRRDRAESLVKFYDRGGRAIHRWLDENNIDVTDLSAIAESFFNVNTPDDVAALRQ